MLTAHQMHAGVSLPLLVQNAAEDLKAMVEPLQRVYLVQRAEGSVPRGPAVEHAACAHMNERHGAHVTRLTL